MPVYPAPPSRSTATCSVSTTSCATRQADDRLTQIPVQTNCRLGTEGGEDINAVRVALRWIASDNIEDNFIGDDTRDRSEVPALKLHLSTNTQHLGIATGPLLVPNRLAVHHWRTSYTTYATLQAARASPIPPSHRPASRVRDARRSYLCRRPTRSTPGDFEQPDLEARGKLHVDFHHRSASLYRRSTPSKWAAPRTPAQLLNDTWSQRSSRKKFA